MGSIMPFADGGVFGAGRVQPFAKGGIVSQATAFPMRGGTTGLMGEAGPEAILPLSRGPDGRLGVAAGGSGGPLNVTFNISTPDVAGFNRSQTQIAAQMGRLLARGNRNR
jgi:lambda family phage tail tape measure protein